MAVYTAAEVVDALRDCIGKVCERLDVVDKLFVPRSVDQARLAGQSARRLAFLPLPAVYHQDVLPGILSDNPIANHSEKTGWFTSSLVLRDIHVHRRRYGHHRKNAQGAKENISHSSANITHTQPPEQSDQEGPETVEYPASAFCIGGERMSRGI